MNFITTAFDKLAGAAGVSWLGVLPWALLGIGASIAGAGAWGYHAGGSNADARWTVLRDKADAAAAAAYTQQLAHTAEVSLNIVTVARDYLAEINLSQYKRAQIVKKVTANVKANPDAYRCPVPSIVLELRQQQVVDSAAIAAKNRPM